MVFAVSTAQAAELEKVTLGCIGTVTDVDDGKSKPIARVITVNFKTRTVQGLNTRSLPITGEDSTIIFFYEEVDRGLGPTIHSDWISETEGSISRLTGVLTAEEKRWKRTGQKAPSNLLSSKEYFLKCRPAQQMF
jgi:hypothetical protein